MNLKFNLQWLKCIILALSMLGSAYVVLGSTYVVAQNKIKNVILMIPDGCSSDFLAIGRWVNNGLPLALDERIRGFVRTYCSDSPISDSAPAGSTYSTGHKSKSGYIATMPDSVMDIAGKRIAVDTNSAFSPMFTIMEAAKLQSMATGLVFTCYLPHATPASFLAHTPKRNDYFRITKQMVNNPCDIVLGGGSYYIDSSIINFGFDAVDALKKNDIFYTHSWKEWNSASIKGKNKIWGLFAPMELSYDIDRNPSVEPSIEEMTVAALEVLSRSDNGFFLMVEGSKIDYASHNNDVPAGIYDFLAFDKAVRVASDFAKKDGNTIVIVCPDHQTGGISMGSDLSTPNYSHLSVEQLFGNIKKYKTSYEQTAIDLYNSLKTEKYIDSITFSRYNISLSNEDIISVKNIFEKENRITRLTRFYASVLNKHQYIGWTTNGHTGGDVFLYLYDPNEASQKPENMLAGVVEGDVIAPYLVKQLGWASSIDNARYYLDSLSNTYYVNPQKIINWDKVNVVYPSINAGEKQKVSDKKKDNTTKKINESYSTDKRYVTKEPLYMELTKGKNTWRLYPNVSYIELNGKKLDAGGIVVFNGIDFFAPSALF